MIGTTLHEMPINSLETSFSKMKPLSLPGVDHSEREADATAPGDATSP